MSNPHPPLDPRIEAQLHEAIDAGSSELPPELAARYGSDPGVLARWQELLEAEAALHSAGRAELPPAPSIAPRVLAQIRRRRRQWLLVRGGLMAAAAAVLAQVLMPRTEAPDTPLATHVPPQPTPGVELAELPPIEPEVVIERVLLATRAVKESRSELAWLSASVLGSAGSIARIAGPIPADASRPSPTSTPTGDV